MQPRIWFLETRPSFLLLAVVLALHGAALAFFVDGSIDLVLALLAGIALVFLHAAVNTLNGWHDYARTGIDLNTRPTPFSGGNSFQKTGELTSNQVLAIGLAYLAVGTVIGLYLAWVAGWQLLLIGVLGILSIVLYTPFFTRFGVGELVSGLGLGTLPIVGMFFLLTGRFDLIAWISGIPAGLLTYNLLFLNEFPDAEADRTGGRRHLVILLGKKHAGWLYTVVELGTYVAVVAGVATRVMPVWSLGALGGLFFALRAVRGALKDYDRYEDLIPAQAANIGAVIITNVLLAAGYVVAALA